MGSRFCVVGAREAFSFAGAVIAIIAIAAWSAADREGSEAIERLRGAGRAAPRGKRAVEGSSANTDGEWQEVRNPKKP